jgi:glycogen operon protein
MIRRIIYGLGRKRLIAAVDEASWAEGNWPLGARLEGGGRGRGGDRCTFAVHAPAAERLLLEVYDEAFGADAALEFPMACCADGIWRARLCGVSQGCLYGYRAWGPNWRYDPAWARGGSRSGFVSDVDAAGNRFNPNKLLIDPYAREISHEKLCPQMLADGDDAGCYGTGGADIDPGQVYLGPLAWRQPTGWEQLPRGQGLASTPLTQGLPARGQSSPSPRPNRREIDTGPVAPKSVVVRPGGSFGKKPGLPPEDAIIYEAHIRGLTAHPSASRLASICSGLEGFERAADVPDGLRGTYAGAALMAPYIKALGFSAVELLPVQETAAGLCPQGRPGGNFWGYMTTSFFAPDRRYAADKGSGGPTREFKAMVKAFHDEGIEVYLDVVYNHTAEGGVWDASRASTEILSFRGLDNAGYYALCPGDKSSYWESTGCGNNLNAGSSVVRALVLDSLAYWLDEMGVDGFRFDLAPVLGRVHRENYGFDPRGELLVSIADLAASRNAEVIAESWDTVLGGYQVGNFPNRWAEWNGRYRDSVRRFMKGDPGGPISPADALHGDWLHFEDQGGPELSINFVDAHDGFTLADLVSYNAKSNGGSWPFGPSDGGSDSNDSWDSAWAAPASGCPDYRAFRRQRWRNFVAFLMLSRGVPMLVYGDELCRTQNGNNNPYNLDSPATWNNYDSIRTDSPQAVPTGAGGQSYHDNFGPDSVVDGWSACFRFLSFMVRLRRGSRALRQGSYDMSIAYSRPDGSAGYDSDVDEAFCARIDGSAVDDRDFLLLVNLSYETVHFRIAAPDEGTRWTRIVDTAHWAESWNNVWEPEEAEPIGQDYEAKACSIVILEAS